MEISFEGFKQKMMATLPIGWEVFKEEKDGFILQQANITLEYRNNQEIMNKLVKEYRIPFVVYSVQRIEDGEFFLKKTYKAVCEYQGTLFRFDTRVKWLNKPCPMKVQSYTMDDEWNQSKVDEIPSELHPFRTAFLEAIQELPEFRLYAVTGMLNEK